VGAAVRAFLDAGIRVAVIHGGGPQATEMQKKLAKTKPDRAIPRAQRELVFVPIEKIRAAVAEEFGIEEKRLDRMRGGADKVAALYLARRLSGLSTREVGEAFGVTATRVSNVARDVEKGAWKSLQNVLLRLEKSLRKASDLPPVKR